MATNLCLGTSSSDAVSVFDVSPEAGTQVLRAVEEARGVRRAGTGAAIVRVAVSAADAARDAVGVVPIFFLSFYIACMMSNLCSISESRACTYSQSALYVITYIIANPLKHCTTTSSFLCTTQRQFEHGHVANSTYSPTGRSHHGSTRSSPRRVDDPVHHSGLLREPVPIIH